MNIAILERTRYMLISFGLPKLFLGEAVKIACYLISKCLANFINNKIHEHVWSGLIHDHPYLRSFVCTIYARHTNSKLDCRSQKCIFVDYGK